LKHRSDKGPVAKYGFPAQRKNLCMKRVSENRRSGGSHSLFLWTYFSNIYFATGQQMNTSTSEAGGCHYAGIALCSSRTRATRNTDLPTA